MFFSNTTLIFFSLLYEASLKDCQCSSFPTGCTLQLLWWLQEQHRLLPPEDKQQRGHGRHQANRYNAQCKQSVKGKISTNTTAYVHVLLQMVLTLTTVAMLSFSNWLQLALFQRQYQQEMSQSGPQTLPPQKLINVYMHFKSFRHSYKSTKRNWVCLRDPQLLNTVIMDSNTSVPECCYSSVIKLGTLYKI